MPRFTITAEFSLSTTIECEVSRYEWDASGVEDFEDSSYWDSNDIECSGGSLTFVVTAEDEDEAHAKAEEVVYDGQEITDSNDLTWAVDSLNITVEEIEEPMTLERAKEILAKIADGMDDEEVEAAVDFVFDHMAGTQIRLDQLVARITGQDEQIRQLSARLAEVPTQIGGAADRLERFVATDDTSVLTEGLPES